MYSLQHHITAGDSAAIYAGRNMKQPDVLHDHDGEGNNKHGELEGEGGLYENGVHALLLDEVGLAGEFKKEDFVFVDFYAPWCIWCQRLEPTWEAFAEKVDLHEKDSFGKTAVVKVDCEEHAKMCGAQVRRAFNKGFCARSAERVARGARQTTGSERAARVEALYLRAIRAGCPAQRIRLLERLKTRR
jgi:hypothetical protein